MSKNGIYPEMELLSWVYVCLQPQQNGYTPTNVVADFCSPTFLPTLGIGRFSNFCLFGGFQIIFHRSFHCLFFPPERIRDLFMSIKNKGLIFYSIGYPRVYLTNPLLLGCWHFGFCAVAFFATGRNPHSRLLVHTCEFFSESVASAYTPFSEAHKCLQAASSADLIFSSYLLTSDREGSIV